MILLIHTQPQQYQGCRKNGKQDMTIQQQACALWLVCSFCCNIIVEKLWCNMSSLICIVNVGNAYSIHKQMAK
jgi:hypothetical protein